jgi:hypothetical protein
MYLFNRLLMSGEVHLLLVLVFSQGKNNCRLEKTMKN